MRYLPDGLSVPIAGLETSLQLDVRLGVRVARSLVNRGLVLSHFAK